MKPSGKNKRHRIVVGSNRVSLAFRDAHLKVLASRPLPPGRSVEDGVLSQVSASRDALNGMACKDATLFDQI